MQGPEVDFCSLTERSDNEERDDGQTDDDRCAQCYLYSVSITVDRLSRSVGSKGNVVG